MEMLNVVKRTAPKGGVDSDYIADWLSDTIKVGSKAFNKLANKVDNESRWAHKELISHRKRLNKVNRNILLIGVGGLIFGAAVKAQAELLKEAVKKQDQKISLLETELTEIKNERG